MTYSIRINGMWVKHTMRGRKMFRFEVPLTADPRLKKIFSRHYDADIQFRDMKSLFPGREVELIQDE